MQLIPAIDIIDGRCVRLLKGDFSKQTVYDYDPVELAACYRRLGAEWLHVVDLDGAKKGQPCNLELVRQMARGEGMRVQLGGGIRDANTLAAAIEVADRVVLGSVAVHSPKVVIDWMSQFGGDRFTLAFDIRVDDGGIPRVATHGWTETTAISLADAIEQYRAAGLAHVLCTDVDRDGAMSGPNLELYAECASRWADVSTQASGGVRNAEDLERLRATGVAAAISGKALLEGRISKEEIAKFLPNA